jgi:hypothetical protein
MPEKRRRTRSSRRSRTPPWRTRSPQRPRHIPSFRPWQLACWRIMDCRFYTALVIRWSSARVCLKAIELCLYTVARPWVAAVLGQESR